MAHIRDALAIPRVETIEIPHMVALLWEQEHPEMVALLWEQEHPEMVALLWEQEHPEWLAFGSSSSRSSPLPNRPPRLFRCLLFFAREADTLSFCLPRKALRQTGHRASSAPLLRQLQPPCHCFSDPVCSLQTSTRLAAASHRSRRQSRRNLSSSVARRTREVLSLLRPYVSPTSTNSKLIHHSTYKYFITSVHPNPKLTEHLHSHQSKLQIRLRTCAVPAPSRPSISIPPGGASTSNPTLVLRPTSPLTLHCSSPTTASWVWISPPAATSPTATTLSVGRRSV
ncbi:uncharacterized protein HKW66_Vig0004810 [Vigna angularis]|uniref:Uncharacterized protein n=1 Tax=Phaseolus angularis TaxID=3914 RepID=A0A8T0LCJ7_PHAAN|nr:uncharacterized protein HKW66_Vig0004810 [Vigna angularis]